MAHRAQPDDDALLHTLESQYTESIGSIVLTLQEVELERGRPRPDRLRGPDRSITNKLIHERAKKMGGHTVGFVSLLFPLTDGLNTFSSTELSSRNLASHNS